MTDAHGFLKATELNAATLCLVKNVQATAFAQELKSLQHDKPLSTDSKLRSLNPFLDEVKAVHLEIAFDLTTEGFLNTLKRFIARRGKLSNIFSDNATTFTSANKELKRLLAEFMKSDHHEGLAQVAAEEGINWHFIPPRAPNFGGIWEAAVKSSKSHFRRVTGTSLLTMDEMQTLTNQIESILNSSPLTILSNYLNDLSFLSPGHFLIGDTLITVPEPTLINVKENRLSRWQRTEQIKQHFWNRWSKDYLNQLQQRNKWQRKGTSINKGNLVILREDNTPPLCWPCGRVQEVHPGTDGVIRAVTVKTSRGIFKRTTNRLCIMPSND
ncbi:uncharacterized protein [Mycetomoellerius zeteki]|uniref:uncharacterized protein n=1 Tax=Mycetomoellerius zeteki TaxID=64791 RepID=UPI00084EC642|nr:PREDICTED: uncharacterized protein LOC108721288 [Trachymyrmex zeteki]